MKRLRDSDDPLVHAGLYEWVLNKIDSDHPLYGVSYVGQVVRAHMSLQQAFEKRTAEEVAYSKKNPKYLGLYWAIQTFGVDAFTVQTEWRAQCPRCSEARAHRGNAQKPWATNNFISLPYLILYDGQPSWSST